VTKERQCTENCDIREPHDAFLRYEILIGYFCAPFGLGEIV
jgi:hypothetical protein